MAADESEQADAEGDRSQGNPLRNVLEIHWAPSFELSGHGRAAGKEPVAWRPTGSCCSALDVADPG